ncbi:MAG: D-alanine:D-lactate ligase-like protein [Rhizobiaceae bacterium]
MSEKTLLLVYETEDAGRKRLAADGIDADRAFEVSSYLAQSTDLAPEFAAIGKACAARGLAFRPVELDAAATAIAACHPASTIVWTLTDGIAYFRGGAAPALARLFGLRTFGAEDALFALCQDKFRAGATLAALGLPVPAAGLARDGRWILPPPPSEAGWFVKPNRLGSKIGIWPDSRCRREADALDLSRRIFSGYGDDAIVQPYVSGRNVRASFLAVESGAGPEALGVFFVDSGADFQTMADSLALYGETGEAARAAGAYVEPELIPVATVQPGADRAIRALAGRMMDGLGLRDVFSIDLRVGSDGTVHLIEFEVAPGLPCFDFRAYCRTQWGMTLAEAMAAAAALKLSS